MKKTKIVNSKGETLYIKNRGIPKGCQYCLNGAKTVFFLNGICQNPEHCWWYCPISKERKGKDDTYANEIQIQSKEELIEEIIKANSKGISITGGDPLFKDNLKKTIDYIKFLKSKMGKKFHIHLYTNGLNFSNEIANQLTKSGLDEIRFNPSNNNWDVIKFALEKGMSVGAEVPIIPDDEYLNNLEKFILFLDEIGADFINLNEFEFCFPNSEQLKLRGFKLKEGTMASVDGSKEYAERLLNKLSPLVSLKIHFCPIIAKDYYQLKERYLRRAYNIKMPYEIVTEEGLLMFGQIQGDPNQVSLFIEEVERQFGRSLEIFIEEGLVKVTISSLLNKKIQDLIKFYKLNAYVVEITPFREKKYCQITEKTPLKIFKEEHGYED